MLNIKNLIKYDIYCDQTALVRHLLSEDCIYEDPDWIERLTHPNFYYRDDKGNDREKDIWQWLLVTPWLAEHLEAVGEPVLHLYSHWWGRTDRQMLTGLEMDDALFRVVVNVSRQCQCRNK